MTLDEPADDVARLTSATAGSGVTPCQRSGRGCLSVRRVTYLRMPTTATYARLCCACRAHWHLAMASLALEGIPGRGRK